MLKKEVEIGGKYVARISGKMTIVRIDRQIRKNKQGWIATNLRTNREIRINGAGKLRRSINDELAQKFMSII